MREKMDILELVKNRKTIRRYEKKKIPSKILEKIIEAGVWGPSVPSFLKIQPWKFVVITDQVAKSKLVEVVVRKAKESPAGVNVMLSSASRIIDNANVAILIFNSEDLEKVGDKYKEIMSRFKKLLKVAELSAIAATIQNMILVAESLGIGSCWLDTPLFCNEEIKKLFKSNKNLAAVLALGYSNELGSRSPRKPLTEMVRYIK